MNYVIMLLNKIKYKSEQFQVIYSQFQQYFIDNFQPIDLTISFEYKSLFKLNQTEKNKSNDNINNNNLIEIFPLFPQNIDINLHPYIGILQTYLQDVYENIISFTSKWICSSSRNYLSNDISYTEKCLSSIVYSLLCFSYSVSTYKALNYENEVSNYNRSQFIFNNTLIWNNKNKIDVNKLIYVYIMLYLL